MRDKIIRIEWSDPLPIDAMIESEASGQGGCVELSS